MNVNVMMQKASSLMHKTGFKIKEHSPQILVVSGIVMGVGAAVHACFMTIHAKEFVDHGKAEIEDIRRCEQKGVNLDGSNYSKEEADHDVAKTYIRVGVDVAKLYLPSVVLGGAGVVSILAGNNILKNRNEALLAAYATVSNSFKGYRNRVTDRFGEEVERELYYNIRNEEVKETVVDEETGKKKTVKKTIQKCDMQEGYCNYARFFDKSTSRTWEPSDSYNDMFLLAQQNLANQRLMAQRYLLLNDVYEELGMEKTKAGAIVGWIYDEENPTGDNYVDFCKMKVMVGDEEKILLDFNVDGPILDAAVSRHLMMR